MNESDKFFTWGMLALIQSDVASEQWAKIVFAMMGLGWVTFSIICGLKKS